MNSARKTIHCLDKLRVSVHEKPVTESQLCTAQQLAMQAEVDLGHARSVCRELFEELSGCEGPWNGRMQELEGLFLLWEKEQNE